MTSRIIKFSRCVFFFLLCCELTQPLSAKDLNFSFNIRWSKSLSDYAKGKLATISETYEEKWRLTVHNSYSATLSRGDVSIDVLPLLKNENFTGLIRAKTTDIEKFLQIIITEKDPNLVPYQLIDLKFHDYFNQKYSFKINKSNTTLVEIIVLPEFEQ